jgi:hypothetical protein
MGGSAFNLDNHGFTTSRMTPKQYSSLTSLILPLLQLYFRRVSIPPSMPGKPTYGDLDIFVSSPLDLHPHDAILQLCSRSLGKKCKKFIYNRPTTNIAVETEDRVYQVDIHFVEREELWDLDFWMHSLGDVGMIVSSTIKAWGLRLSASRGLYIEIPVHGTFILSYDIYKVITFLGLSCERYEAGFLTVEEIFTWIEGITINNDKIGIKSLGKLERKEHGNRGMWVDYWSRGILDEEYGPCEEAKKRAQQSAIDFFGKRGEYDSILERLERERLAKEKFNANKVREWTGAEGRRLGVLMKRLKEDGRVGVERVGGMSEEEIRSVVMEVWNGLH